MAYLYGASVQGIQGFIFETNKLKEIVGASDLVEEICTDFIPTFLKERKLSSEKVKWIVGAAGNIKFVCDEEEMVKTIVKHLPKAIQELAPGITISQAVVKLDKGLQKESMDSLEDKLKIQRNKPVRPAQVGLTIVKRAPRTGRPAFVRNEELLDLATDKKRTRAKKEASTRLARKLLGKENKTFQRVDGQRVYFPLEMSDIVRKDHDDWLAVIHADTNNLGAILQSLGKKLTGFPEKVAEGYRNFSEALNKATCAAAQKAFQEVVIKGNSFPNEKFPLRPLVLGGDDLTVVCRSDLAIKFTIKFLQEFQKATTWPQEENGSLCPPELKNLVQDFSLDLFSNGLTACAGIAFIKESYPFHYAYHLAEELCSAAKKRSKEIDSQLPVPASMAFHKVHSSFQHSYADTVRRELVVKNGEEMQLNFGPYTIENSIEGMPCIEDLLQCVRLLQAEDAPRSGLRRWLSELYNDRNVASQLLHRVREISQDKSQFDVNKFDEAMKQLMKGLSLENPVREGKTPVFDMLMLLSLGGDK